MSTLFDNSPLRIVDLKECVKSPKLENVIDGVLNRIFYFKTKEISILNGLLHDERPDLESQLNAAIAINEEEEETNNNDYDEKLDPATVEIRRLSHHDLIELTRQLFVAYSILKVQFAKISHIEQIKNSLEQSFLNLVSRLQQEKVKSMQLQQQLKIDNNNNNNNDNNSNICKTPQSYGSRTSYKKKKKQKILSKTPKATHKMSDNKVSRKNNSKNDKSQKLKTKTPKSQKPPSNNDTSTSTESDRPNSGRRSTLKTVAFGTIHINDNDDNENDAECFQFPETYLSLHSKSAPPNLTNDNESDGDQNDEQEVVFEKEEEIFDDTHDEKENDDSDPDKMIILKKKTDNLDQFENKIIPKMNDQHSKMNDQLDNKLNELDVLINTGDD